MTLPTFMDKGQDVCPSTWHVIFLIEPSALVIFTFKESADELAKISRKEIHRKQPCVAFIGHLSYPMNSSWPPA